MGPGQILCQEATEGTRQLWDDNLQRRRPPKAGSKPRPAPRPSAEQPAASEKLGDSFVGFTLWHLRPSRNNDEPGTRLLVQEESTGTREELTPQRVEASKPLPNGAKVRVSIEAARAGYLYVVDREQYADGSLSDPYLIFPTTRIRGGNNAVGPGAIVEIPDPEDKTPYFRLRRNRARQLASGQNAGPEQVGEVLTVLVSPTPLPGVRIGPSAQKLSRQQLNEWEKQWGTQTKMLESTADTGKAYTQVEQRAAKEGTLLTSEDPLPQTLIECKARPGDPLLVSVPIRIAK